MTNPTTRYTLHVPLADNDGRSLAELHVEVHGWLAERFDGVTELDADGAWLVGPHIGREPIRLYIVDTSDPSAADYFRLLAQRVKDRAAQDAVYVTAQPIMVELV